MVDVELELKKIKEAFEKSEEALKEIFYMQKCPIEVMGDLMGHQGFKHVNYSYKVIDPLFKKGNELKKFKGCGVYVITCDDEFVKNNEDIFKEIYTVKGTPKYNKGLSSKSSKGKRILYIGKAELDLKKRIGEHINLKKDQETSSLKLKSVLEEGLESRKLTGIDAFMDSIEFDILYMNKKDTEHKRELSGYYVRNFEKFMHRHFKPQIGNARG